MTYEEFKSEVLGKGFDVDGYYGEQCWDLFAYYCKRLGYSPIHCTGTGYAQDLWEKRATNGILKYFDEVTMMNPGDVAIFKRTASTPLSHVAIFDHDIDGKNGAFLGQNQGGKVVSSNGGSAANIISLPYSATYDTAFRPKCFKSTQQKPAADPHFPLIGVDISEHNSLEGWEANDFIIPRCSYGENEDANFGEYVRRYKNLIKGVYVFSYALDRKQAKQEAQYAIALVKKYGLKDPVIFYDFEYDSVNWAKKNGVTIGKAEVQGFTDAFTAEIANAGYKTGVYLNLDYWNNFYGGYSFKDRLIWFAYYGKTLPIDRNAVDVWQYSSEGYDHNRAKKSAFDFPKKTVVSKGEDGSVYRLYNPNNGDHMYTVDFVEAKTLASAGWSYEGIEWKAPDKGNPVYRLYDVKSGRHLFTDDVEEKKSLIHAGWIYEKIAFFSSGSHPIYRLYNPNGGEHVLSAKRKEHNALSAAGWYCEGQELKY